MCEFFVCPFRSWWHTTNEQNLHALDIGLRASERGDEKVSTFLLSTLINLVCGWRKYLCFSFTPQCYQWLLLYRCNFYFVMWKLVPLMPAIVSPETNHVYMLLTLLMMHYNCMFDTIIGMWCFQQYKPCFVILSWISL